MHILFITPRLPYPLLKGDQLRTYYFIKYLHLNGHRISLISFIERKEEKKYVKKLLDYCENIETVFLPPIKSYFNVLMGCFSNHPFQVSYYLGNKMLTTINKKMKNNTFDIVHFVLLRMIPYAKLIKDTPKIIDYIDSLGLNMERRYKREKGIMKLIVYYEWKKIRFYESNSHKMVNYAIVTSPFDKEYISNNNIEIIPNGVEIEKELYIKKDIDLIFSGNMGYFPNEDAVIYFHKNIFPFILEKKPDIKFYIVGINPSLKIRKLEDKKNIFVTGFVESLRDYLIRARVAVCPMKSGSGIQNKILEAMACGTPVVASSVAISSIEAKNLENVLVADDPYEFAKNVLGLLDDKTLSNKISENAKRFVSEKYNWKKVIEKLENAYKLAIINFESNV